ncbi:MAG: glycosyltransferase family 4 protein [Prolixibacteraceae bacterium]|nr:glycosyltransferase family 4 protein [Prolixibacteraceae bacterium]
MNYLILSIILTIILKTYINLADRFNIIDKPNNRSSHSKNTIRGGGIIFPIAALIWFIWSGFHYPMFFAGLSLISLISFWDDISPLSARIRLTVQLTAIFLMFMELGIDLLPWWAWLIILILATGIINAFNFMDGINGITGGYSLSVLSGIWLVNNYQHQFIENEFIYLISISLVIFGFFNFRKKAICFAGDVGSVSIAFILTFILAKLILLTSNPLYILFFSLYGVDTISTIIYRLWKKENIFEAHRKHLYQLVSNELKISQLHVAFVYSTLQLLICAVTFLIIKNDNSGSTNWLFGICSLSLITIIFIGLRFNINKKVDKQKNLNTV